MRKERNDLRTWSASGLVFLVPHCLRSFDLLLMSSPSPCLWVPVHAEDGSHGGYPVVMLLLLFAALGGRIRLLCCSCLLLLKVAEELQLVMTALLLVLALSAQRRKHSYCSRWGRDIEDWDQLLVQR